MSYFMSRLPNGWLLLNLTSHAVDRLLHTYLFTMLNFYAFRIFRVPKTKGKNNIVTGHSRFTR